MDDDPTRERRRRPSGGAPYWPAGTQIMWWSGAGPLATGSVIAPDCNAAEPRFYEERGQAAFSGIAGAEARILGHVALARTVAEERGIALVNFSPVSALSDIGIAFDDRLVR